MRGTHKQRLSQYGFTLIELLVVIAIIALLAAILFPVFATVRENARQSSSISNMRQISTGLAQFQLDNHKSPDVLFGYVYYQYGTTTAIDMDKAFAQAQADAAANPGKFAVTDYFPGLYPEYVRDVASFRDPNNTENGNVPSKVVAADINVVCANGSPATPCAGVTDGKLASVSKAFYAEDAYDVSPQATDPHTLSTTQYVARYQSSWTDIDNTLNADCTGTTPPATCSNNINRYTHQMRWKNPPAETYVTSTTHHIPNASTVLVLWEGGSVKKLNYAQFTQFGTDATTVAVNSGVSKANFWKLTPAGN